MSVERKDDPTDGESSSHELFPSSKIKAILQAQPNIGSIRQPVVDKVAACSLDFMKDFLEQATKCKAENGTLNNILQLSDLRNYLSTEDASERGFTLLHGVMDGLEEGVHVGLPPQRSKRSKKKDPVEDQLKQKRLKSIAQDSKNSVEVALKVAGNGEGLPTDSYIPSGGIVADEDDYD